MGKKKENREPRKKASKKFDLTKPIDPIDISKFGGDDDPCFGKLYDLSEDPCKRCGDSTVCGILFNQVTEQLRKGEEDNSRFKDLELGENTPMDEKAVKKVIKEKMKKGTIGLLITKQIMVEFGLNKEKAKELVKSCKK